MSIVKPIVWGFIGIALAIVLGGGAIPAAKIVPPEPVRPPVLDWPMYGGRPERNMANPDVRGLPAFWALADPLKNRPAENIRWTTKLSNFPNCAGIAVADGRVFIGGNNQWLRDPRLVQADGKTPRDLGVLLCFRASDGAFLWQATHRRRESGPVNDSGREVLASTPTVEGDRLYYVSNRGEVVCAATADGKALWSLDMMQTLDVFPHHRSLCSPLIVGEFVYVITGNGVDESQATIPAPDAPSFVAIDKRSGRVMWQDNSPTASLLKLPKEQRGKDDVEQLRDMGHLVLSGQWSSPTYAEAGGQPQVIFPGGDGWLYAFEPRLGTPLWKFDANPKAAKFDFSGRVDSAGRGARSHFLAAPAVADGCLYIGTGLQPEFAEGGEGHLWCIDLAKAVRKGRTNPAHDVSPVNDNVDPHAPVNRDSALAWHYGGPNSRQVWAQAGRRFIFGRTLSTCAVHGGLVYAADIDGQLHCLDATSGTVYWTHNAQASIFGSPLDADGKVYLGTDDGEIVVFAHGKEKRILHKIDMEDRIRTTPIAARGTLYIATGKALFAIANDP